jgi:hypothetical protein
MCLSAGCMCCSDSSMLNTNTLTNTAGLHRPTDMSTGPYESCDLLTQSAEHCCAKRQNDLNGKAWKKLQVAALDVLGKPLTDGVKVPNKARCKS